MAYKYQLGAARLSGSLVQEGDIRSSGDVLPLSEDGGSLGGPSNEWSDLYLADDGKIYFGADQDIILDHRPDAGLRITQNPDTLGEPVLSLLTTGDIAEGPGIHFALDNQAGEADGDILGFMRFYGSDSGNTVMNYAKIEVQSADVTDGTEDGCFFFKTAVNGVIDTTLLDINSSVAGGVKITNALEVGEDLHLKSDDCAIHFGADGDIILDHRPDAGLRIRQNPNTLGEPILSLLTTGDISEGPGIHFALDNQAGEADGDILGFMRFYGSDSGNTVMSYAKIEVQSGDVTNGTEDGCFFFKTVVNGASDTTLLDINSSVAGGVKVANALEVGSTLGVTGLTTLKPSSNTTSLKIEQDNASDGWTFQADSGNGDIKIERDQSGKEGYLSISSNGVVIANRGLVATGIVIDASDGGSMPDSFSCSFIDWSSTGGRYISRGSNDSTHGSYTLRLETKNASSPRDAIIIDTSGNYTFHDGAYNFNIASHDGSNGLKLGGTLVTSTATEINLLDGGTSVGGSITLADSDGLFVNDGGVSKLIPASSIKSYVSDAAVDVALKANGGTLEVGVNYFNDMGSDGEDAVTLPASPDVGQSVRVKAPSDCSEARYITINRAGSQTIDGVTSIRLESPFAAVQLVAVTSGSAAQWRVF